jgi:hypothetical protein
VGITFSDATGQDEQTTLATRSHERDEDQKGIDATVAGMVKAWTDAGKPAPAQATAGMTHRYLIPGTDKSELKRMIRRACVAAKVDPAWYVDGKPDAAGNIVVKFTVAALKPKAPKATANGKTATPAPAPTPTPESTPQPSGRGFGRR